MTMDTTPNTPSLFPRLRAGLSPERVLTSNLAAIAATLTHHGRSPQTPVAVIQDGTTRAQRTLRATLATVAAQAETEAVRPPAVVVIGHVVTALDPFDQAVDRRP